MADVSFAFVPAEGFTAFGAELRTGEWGNVDISDYVGADGRAAKPLCKAPAAVVMKMQLQTAIAEVLGALKNAGSAKWCDDAWDETEKRLGSLIIAAQMSKQLERKAAGERLHKLLLLGEGAGQTKLKYHQEVDFARKQMELAAESQCADDIALLELGDVMTDIAAATNALADAIGHGTTGHAPWKRKSEAVTTCRNVFGAMTKQLAWMMEHGYPGPDKEQAIALHASLVELAGRYPKKEIAKAQATSP